MALTEINLPLDILTEVVSYLPLKSLLKTCTVNRLFLDLSLDFLYQEIYLASTDNISETFKALIRDQRTANRVRRIRIFSSFSEPRCSLFTRDPDKFQKNFNNTLIRLEELRRLIAQKSISSDASVNHHAANPLFKSASKLSGLRELIITTAGTNNVYGFLNCLWEVHGIGESLRKLEVAAGTVDILLLLVNVIRYLDRTVSDGSSNDKNVDSCNVQASRPCITHLSIHFIPEFETMPMNIDVIVINKYLSQLFKLLASTLLSLSLSYASYPRVDIRTVFFSLKTPIQQDFSEVLRNLPYLPALKEIKFYGPFAPRTMKNPEALTDWLRPYQEQLEHLTIRATSLVHLASDYDSDDSERRKTDFNPGNRYSNWLTSCRGFLSLTFAMLSSLEIRLMQSYGQRTHVIPPMKNIGPSLRSLTLGYDDWLDRRGVENHLQGLLTSQEGCCGLETLRLRCIELSPELLDLLHERLPRLKVLVVDCNWRMTRESLDGFSKRKYSWQLFYLRITSVSPIEKHFHPHSNYMRVVAGCLEGDPVLDMGFNCGCDSE